MEEHLRLMQRSRGVQYLREYVDRSDWKIWFPSDGTSFVCTQICISRVQQVASSDIRNKWKELKIT